MEDVSQKLMKTFTLIFRMKFPTLTIAAVGPQREKKLAQHSSTLKSLAGTATLLLASVAIGLEVDQTVFPFGI